MLFLNSSLFVARSIVDRSSVKNGIRNVQSILIRIRQRLFQKIKTIMNTIGIKRTQEIQPNLNCREQSENQNKLGETIITDNR